MSGETTLLVVAVAVVLSVITAVAMLMPTGFFRKFAPSKKHPLAIPAVILVLALLTPPAFAVYYASQIVNASNQRWCTLLSDITFGPAPPKAPVPGPTASTQQIAAYKDWKFYQDLTRLQQEIGCP